METLAYILSAEIYESEFNEITLNSKAAKSIAVSCGMQIAIFAQPAFGLMTVGSNGANVQQLQSQLIALGYPVKDTGVYDDLTKQSVIAFQQATQLAPDGIAGDKTLKALSDVTKGDESVKKPSPTKPETGDENVKVIQENLKRLGVYRGKIDGVLSIATIKAIDEARSISCTPLERMLDSDIATNQW